MDVKLVVIKGSRKRQVLQMPSEETVVGRQQGCELRIPSPLVSRRHCRLTFRDNRLTVEDLHSANGSYVNGNLVERQTLIRPGDQLAIGPIIFRVEYSMAVSTNSPKSAAKKQVKANLTEDEKDVEEAIEMAELVEQTTNVVEEIEDAIPLADDPGPSTSASDARTLDFDDMKWKAPNAGDFRDILADMDDG
jgi:pSer/pThr/pTyr-binding forkhead associated (FHA) protein